VSHRIRRSRQDRFVRVVVYAIVTLIVVGMIIAMVGSALAAPVASVSIGRASDEIYIGDWDGDGKDTVAPGLPRQAVEDEDVRHRLGIHGAGDRLEHLERGDDAGHALKGRVPGALGAGRQAGPGA